MEPNQRDAKLAAARKKLKQFKEKQKAVSPAPHANGYTTSSSPVPFTNGSASFSAKGGESSTVESILQLSTQLNGLLDERHLAAASADALSDGGDASASSQNHSPNDLEARNRHLAEMVKNHKEASLQFEKRNSELQRHNEELQRRLEEERDAQNARYVRELQHAKEQLQVHIQTIGILVEEKQALQKSTNQSQRQLQQKSDELEELSGRLKASRQRVAELEKQLAQAVSTKQQHEQQIKDSSKDVDRLKMDVYRKSKELEELLQQKSELTVQLESKAAQCGELEASVTDLSGKLDMSIAYVQQLSGGSSGGAEEMSLYAQQTEELRREKAELYEKVMQYEDAYRRLAAEREQLTAQYTQVISAMEDRYQHYAAQLQQALADRDAAQARANELEAQRAAAAASRSGDESTAEAPADREGEQASAASSAATTAARHDVKVEELLAHCELLRQQLEAVARNCDVLSADNAQLSKLLEEREERLSELESLSERLQDEQESRQRLLDATQSDKTALSRALSQNRELKAQLEELQNRFVAITNDNMDTATRLQSQEHSARELASRLEQLESEHTAALAELEERGRRLERVEEGEARAARLVFQQDQLADRIRHYEAQAQLVETLQRELHASQEAVTALTRQNGDLRRLVVQAANAPTASTDSADGDDQVHHRDWARSQEMVASLSAAIRQLEMERNQVLAQYEEMKHENELLVQQVANSRPSLLDAAAAAPFSHDDSLSSAEFVPLEQYRTLENSMLLLQDKFSALAQLRADLLDASERLQHENAQLQGEAETIGDYISMYHQQRAVMKERSEAKDRCIAQLAHERDGVLAKVTELQALVFRLLQERDALHSYPTGSDSAPKSDGYSAAVTLHAVSPSLLSMTDHQSDSSALRETDSSLLRETDDWPDGDPSSEANLSQTLPEMSRLYPEPLSAAGIETTHRAGLLEDRPMPSASPRASAVTGGETQGDTNTAHRIMALLSEMGRSAGEHAIASRGSSHRVLHCSHCSGPIYAI